MKKASKSAQKAAPRPSPPAVEPHMDPAVIRVIWLSLALAVAACAFYASSWRHGFAGDDSLVIQRNVWTQQGLSALPQVVSHSLYYGAVPLNDGLYRPVAGAYYVLVGAVVGVSPEGYHIAQILLYGLNAAIVFLFLSCLTRRAGAVPIVATVLFIAHPIHTEVVNNIKSADEMLCLAFFLMSAMAWLQFADTARARWRYLSVAAYAFAVCSKETAVPLVIMLPALWYFFRQRPVRTSLIAAWPFLGVSLAYVAVRQVVLNAEPATDIVTLLNNALLATSDQAVQIASALAYLAKYMRMLLWPYPLSFDYGYNAIPLHTFRDPLVWMALALLAGLGAVLIRGFRARRVEAFAALWFVASMIAVSNLLLLISTNFGERLLYIPSVVVCYVAARLLFTAAKIGEGQTLSSALRSPVVAVPLFVVLLLSSLLVIRRTREWRDQIALFTADVKTYPNSARLNNYLGNLLYFEGHRLMAEPAYAEIATADLTSAKTHLLRGLEILDQFQDMHAVLGMAEYELKQYREAIPHLERSLAFKDYRASALAMMADSYKQLQMPDQAREVLRQIDAGGIQDPVALFELANDAAARGDDDASIGYFQRFIALQPDNVAANFNLAKTQNRKGDFAGSLASAERCIALQPTPPVHASCLILAADALARTGHADKALAYFEKAKKIDPTNPWIRGSGSPGK